MPLSAQRNPRVSLFVAALAIVLAAGTGSDALGAPAKLHAFFTAEPNPSMTGVPVRLDASKSAGPAVVTRYSWDLDDDGEIDIRKQTPKLAAKLPAGQQEVWLLVRDAKGSTAAFRQAIQVKRPPALEIQVPDALRKESPARFRTVELGSEARFRWDFGDSESGPACRCTPLLDHTVTAVPKVKHAYDNNGHYDLHLVAGDGDGALLAAARQIVVGNSTPGPLAGGSLSDAHPAIGDPVFANAGASSGKSLAYRFDWGDGTVTSWQSGALAHHDYDLAGAYRVQISVRALSGVVAAIRLDEIVGAAQQPADTSGCAEIAGTGVSGTALVCTDTSSYAACMVDLRDATDIQRCELEGHPNVTAEEAESPGVEVVPATCSADGDLPTGGYRCDDQADYLHCRALANGNRHDAAYGIRHCADGDVPDELEIDSHGQFEVSAAGTFTGSDGELSVSFAPPVVSQPPASECNPAVAAVHGGTCVRSCQFAYYLFSMTPDGPSIPVIQNLPCGSTFNLPTIADLGDTPDIARESCEILTDGLSPGAEVDFESTVYVNVDGEHVINNPETTGSAGGNSTYSDTHQPEPAGVAHTGVPSTITCEA